jgi:putative nucleotidyltransferase with HDIG domain
MFSPAIRETDLRLKAVEAIIASPNLLPATFELMPRLLLVFEDPEPDFERVGELIRIDPSLTADILRISNSALMGGARRTESVNEAISRVGLREVFRIVMEILTSPLFKSVAAAPYQRIDLWRHSLATAVASQVLARHVTGEDPEVAFTAGLLHDIGKALFSRAARADYLQLLQLCADQNMAVFETEREEFGANHAQIGARLLRSWKFSDRIAAAIEGHHAPLEAKRDHAQLAAIIYAGNILAYRIEEGNGCPGYVVNPDEDALASIDLRPTDLSGYEDEVRVMLQAERERLS